MKKAARRISEQAAARLAVPAAEPDRRGHGHDRAAAERDHRVARPDQPRPRPVSRYGPAAMLLRLIERTAVLVVSLAGQLGAGVRVHGRAARRPGPGRAGRQRVRRGGGASCARQFGLDRPLSTQYLDWLGGLLRGDFGTSYVIEGGDRAADRRPAAGDAVAGRRRHGHRAGDRGARSGRHGGCGTGRPSGLALSRGLPGRRRRAGVPRRHPADHGVRGAAGLAARRTAGRRRSRTPVMFVRQLMLPALALGLVQGAVLTRYVR